MEPLTYLEPFLEVIRSPETSGPITGVALTSVRRLLEDYTFGEYPAARAQLLHVITMVQDEALYGWSIKSDNRCATCL